MEEKIIIYYASAYGFTQDGRDLILPKRTLELENIGVDEIKVFEPFREAPFGTPEEEVIKSNRAGRKKATTLVAILDGSGIDTESGVSKEIADFEYKKPIFALSTDKRRDLKTETKGLNHEIYYPLVETAKELGVGGLFHCWEDLLNALAAYIKSVKKC